MPGLSATWTADVSWQKNSPALGTAFLYFGSILGLYEFGQRIAFGYVTHAEHIN